MSEILWVIVSLIAGVVLFFTVRRWHRRQRAGRLADVLLSDVLKAKDSYRR